MAAMPAPMSHGAAEVVPSSSLVGLEGGVRAGRRSSSTRSVDVRRRRGRGGVRVGDEGQPRGRVAALALALLLLDPGDLAVGRLLDGREQHLARGRRELRPSTLKVVVRRRRAAGPRHRVGRRRRPSTSSPPCRARPPTDGALGQLHVEPGRGRPLVLHVEGERRRRPGRRPRPARSPRGPSAGAARRHQGGEDEGEHDGEAAHHDGGRRSGGPVGSRRYGGAMAHVRWTTRPTLQAPVVIAAFEGWNDAGDAASTAARYLVERWDLDLVAEVDPEEFYDFTSTRPEVQLDDDGHPRDRLADHRDLRRHDPGRRPGRRRDHRHRAAAAVAHLLRRAHRDRTEQHDARLCLTLGALLAEVPHTRPTPIVGTAYEPDVVAGLELQPSRYEGPTGIVGVLHDAWRARRASAPPRSGPRCRPTSPARRRPRPRWRSSSAPPRCSRRGCPPPTSRSPPPSYERQVSELVDADEETATYVASPRGAPRRGARRRPERRVHRRRGRALPPRPVGRVSPRWRRARVGVAGGSNRTLDRLAADGGEGVGAPLRRRRRSSRAARPRRTSRRRASRAGAA